MKHVILDMWLLDNSLAHQLLYNEADQSTNLIVPLSVSGKQFRFFVQRTRLFVSEIVVEELYVPIKSVLVLNLEIGDPRN